MKWLADENFRNTILRGIQRKASWFDVVRAQDIAEVAGRDDGVLLGFATAEGRIVLTHDVSTMVPAMRQQIQRAGSCAPIVLVPDSLAITVAVEDLILLSECGVEEDWAGGVLYLPLR